MLTHTWSWTQHTLQFVPPLPGATAAQGGGGRMLKVAGVAAPHRPARWRRRCDPDVAGTAPGLAWSEGFWSVKRRPGGAASPRPRTTPAQGWKVHEEPSNMAETPGSCQLTHIHYGCPHICAYVEVWHSPFLKSSTSWSRCSCDGEAAGGSRPDKPDLYWSNLTEKGEGVRITATSRHVISCSGEKGPLLPSGGKTRTHRS